MYGLTRGTMTLLGAAVAGFLLWVASQMSVDEMGPYWAYVGLIAAAGLTMALSQLLGGWTKWGWPRITAGVLLLGFLPALVVGGLVLLYAQPDGGAFGAGFASDLGVEGLAEDLVSVLPAIAFGLGLTFGFTFDTTGPRRTVVREDVADRELAERQTRPHDYAGVAPVDGRAVDEPVAAERTAAYDDGDGRVRDRNADVVTTRRGTRVVRNRDDD
jgi:hypothetical protein